DIALGDAVSDILLRTAGRASRIIGTDFGSCATFAQVGRSSATDHIDAVPLPEILDRICDRRAAADAVDGGPSRGRRAGQSEISLACLRNFFGRASSPKLLRTVFAAMRCTTS